MQPESIVAIVTVVVTGIVSILNGLVPVLIDSRKSKREEATAKREKEAAEVERIDETTTELLSHLSHFRHWTVSDIEQSYHGPAQKAYSELRAKHYAWEFTIWSRLNEAERGRVKSLRKKFEEVHTPDTIDENVPDLSQEILSLSTIAAGRA
jgi:hypothetical protein